MPVSPFATPRRMTIHTPFKTPHSLKRGFNDDASERDLRRKSLMESAKRRRSELFTPRRRISILEGSPKHTPRRTPGTPNRRLTNLVSSPLPVAQMLSAEEISHRYEEWMKIAADNKINANNTWDFALIDFFYDMSLLKDGESVNFQKASCTLDGCIKIYTSRVDSVASETGKLLNGLAESINTKTRDSMDEEEGGRKSKKSYRSENTLAKDFTSLTLKQFDLEFAVDPLFKKTSADFDEGGARGLLLNHLSIHNNGKIIFDASDAAPFDKEVSELEQDEADIDIGKLKDKFFDNFDDFLSRDICPSLQSFELASDTSPDITALKKVIEDFAENELYDEQNDDYDDDDDDIDNQDDHHIPFFGSEANDDFGSNHFEDGEDDVRVSEQAGPGQFNIDFVPMANGGDDVYSYFDSAFMKNWAGPEHWKLQRAPKEKVEIAGESQKKKAEKQQFQIDFIESRDVDEKKLFAPANNPTLAKPSEKTAAKTLLPDDMHFSSKNLLSLFTKPQVSMITKKRPAFDEDGEYEGAVFGDEGNTYEIGNHFAADALSQADTQASSNFYNDAIDENHDDDDDDGPFPDVDDGVDFGEQLVTQPKFIKPEYLNYAKTAKKVDVKKLKDNIWKELVTDESTEVPDSEDLEERKVEGTQRFTDVMTNLKQVYPENKMQDISVSFCFICLLHLANEKNLEITSDDLSSDLIVKQSEDLA
ncbi:barren [Basidiobolus meristosporus CBS 931.73]|uniref:Condensin complex subunit 2 n=1 Tax=Basidiobolus meristosporus CBS 931.73 TaxID=1314790 RepID=A0A1Y1YDY1_9FUNG|nr:barren [Basidiobolus meristosporus CBS 931.73]|eukprot:ORX96251.1 barren [Basidiobolus meristosporus CBS 931.73]